MQTAVFGVQSALASSIVTGVVAKDESESYRRCSNCRGLCRCMPALYHACMYMDDLVEREGKREWMQKTEVMFI